MARAIGVSMCRLIHDMFKGKWNDPKPEWLKSESVHANRVVTFAVWGENKYCYMRSQSEPQRKFAVWLHHEADVPTNILYGMREAEKFQSVVEQFGIGKRLTV